MLNAFAKLGYSSEIFRAIIDSGPRELGLLLPKAALRL
jgi:hypothetical protein